MSTRNFFLFVVLSSVAMAAADDKSELPDAPGRATVLKLCNECHGAEIVVGRPHSEEGWNAIVIDMVQRGAQGTDDEFDEIVRYLTKNIKAGEKASPPKLNVNKVSAKAIETGLGLTAKEAEAIVTARGKAAFRSVEDVKKVSGVTPRRSKQRKKDCRSSNPS